MLARVVIRLALFVDANECRGNLKDASDGRNFPAAVMKISIAIDGELARRCCVAGPSNVRHPRSFAELPVNHRDPFPVICSKATWTCEMCPKASTKRDPECCVRATLQVDFTVLPIPRESKCSNT